MKKYIITGLLALSIVVAGSTMLQSQTAKIKAFNESLQYEQSKNYKQALSSIEKIYSDNAKDYFVNLRMGWLYYNLLNYDKSEKYYRLATEINSKSIEAMIGLTYPLAAKEQWKEVEALYQKILKIDGMNYTANLRLGQMYLYRSDYTGAKKYLERIYYVYQSDYELNLYFGWVMYYLGDKNNAREMFTRVLMQNSKDASANEGYNLVK
ncbi:MAG: hypothetical protein IT279_04845 [Ignavibacteriaceae bacterium]|nr:hypothetical protein [Ignavibacteriaceae bacterium]